MLALRKCLFIIIATIQNNDNNVQNILQSNLKGTARSKKYDESTTWHTQAQHEQQMGLLT